MTIHYFGLKNVFKYISLVLAQIIVNMSIYDDNEDEGEDDEGFVYVFCRHLFALGQRVWKRWKRRYFVLVQVKISLIDSTK